MRNYFRYAIYLTIAYGFHNSFAGSFEDYFIAIRNDNVGVVVDLLNRGFDANTRDERGQPGLVIAIREQSPKTARVLLERREIDINALNRQGESALMIAAIQGDLAQVRVLVERGARINQPGWSPLHYAASGPEPQVVKWLLDRGADIDAVSPNGSTPLMMAAQYGAIDSATMLLERGADPRRRNQLGLSAADFAIRAGRDGLANRLTPSSR